MLENSWGLNFFLKSQSGRSDNFRYVYLRIIINGMPKETSTKRKWDVQRWNQHLGRATGTKEDARSINYFLDSLVTKINNYRTELMNNGITITASRIMDFVKGNHSGKTMVLEEFQKHNEEVLALVDKQYAKGTYIRYVTARSHVKEFIFFKYKREDLEFSELNYEFVKDYEFYLKIVRNCSHNTVMKYISNFKKIVLRAIDKEIIFKNPFTAFKSKKIKIKKYPLTKAELLTLENHDFKTERLTITRDVFVFQCYTGLAYIDVYQLMKTDIKEGIDGKLWIVSNRQKTKSTIGIPLLPKALEIMEKYIGHPTCISRGSILPVKSNQRMNEYLNEIAGLCNIGTKLNTHKARRTFASTVTLGNGVSIHVVKKMLGHHSINQTEEYAITEQEMVGKEMLELSEKLSLPDKKENSNFVIILEWLESEAVRLKNNQVPIKLPDL
ncbi:integrase [Chryseobacterium ginsenosidimutans]|uniref:site-specific integrase n=1 Tax=Chryseobacterium ginsenosidimutans TaxID=687846 RepID=UPI00278200D5|nr:site-specific integrase [Chryseobacterium ginsenosidimutans]MDQ0594835.1 integrase [Chryseobacterium ginsenosidimutans]